MSTRSGIVYSRSAGVSRKLKIEIPSPVSSIELRRSPRLHKETKTRPSFFEPSPSSDDEVVVRRSARIAMSSLSAEILRELRDEHDYDSTSDYDEEEEEEEEEIQQPKYEVVIDFDEASNAWRANKRRVGESWEYVTTRSQFKRKCCESSSIADRVKSVRRQASR
jgi:hypothetical protein